MSGSRTWTDSAAIRSQLAWLLADPEFECTIIHGGATGADAIANDLAKEFGCAIDPYPVTRDDWKQYGKAAGPKRNKRMLEEGKPNIVFAFPDPNYSPGTWNLVMWARQKGIPVVVYQPKKRET